jgi:hypothetical protein
MATGTAPQVQVSRTDIGDRQGIDAAPGLPELWRFDGESLRVFRHKLDGAFETWATSPVIFFLPLVEVTGLPKLGATMNHTRWWRKVRGWVRDELTSRDRRAGDEAGQT